MRAMTVVRRVALALAATAAAASTLLAASPANAIVRGTHDDSRTYVGSMWVAGSTAGTYDFYCSGTLLSPTIFVTASHCLAGIPATTQVYVSMDATWPTTGYPTLLPATPHLNPLHKVAQGTDLYNNDVSVLELAAPYASSAGYAQLPSQGLLDALQAAGTLRSQTFTVAGYGTTAMAVVTGKESPGHAGPTFSDTSNREVATVGFNALNPQVLREDQRQNAGFGGAGYGDSGGPSFLGTGRTILGVTSTGDIPCYATNTAARLDTPEARAFLGQFVTLP